tara:strand:- start:2544 stop:3356 length:813 start_codon:yes stop_codon:yes gene_type:complete
MIGFNFIGRMGRLGNQMFQYAALRGIAENCGYKFCFPVFKDAVNDGIGNMLRTELFDCFEMSTPSALNIQLIDSDRPVVDESGFEFDENIFNNCPDWVTLRGYFQTEKYFKNVEKIIRKDFTFKEEYRIPCEEMIGKEEYIALHIRRTDYLQNAANHNNLTLEYYEKALAKFPEDSQVIIFSDDPQWCSEQDLFSDDRFLVSENTNGYVDLCLMSMCKHFIIANSTFSWWGAWLSKNKNKKVIAPSQWFGPANKHLNTEDIYCEGWEIIV